MKKVPSLKQPLSCSKRHPSALHHHMLYTELCRLVHLHKRLCCIFQTQTSKANNLLKKYKDEWNPGEGIDFETEDGHNNRVRIANSESYLTETILCITEWVQEKMDDE